jgi:hypothetical protein
VGAVGRKVFFRGLEGFVQGRCKALKTKRLRRNGRMRQTMFFIREKSTKNWEMFSQYKLAD